MKNQNTEKGTRSKKFKLKPVPAIENNRWNLRVNKYYDYLIYQKEKVIANFDKWIKEIKTSLESENLESENAIKLEKRIKTYKNKQDKAKKERSSIIEEKTHFNDIVKNGISNDKEEDFIKNVAKKYTYNLIKRCCISEAQKKNATLSYVYSQCLLQNIHKIDDKKTRNEKISALFNFCNRKENKNKSDEPGSLLDILEIENPLEGYGFMYKQVLRSSFINSVDKGLFDGKMSLPNFRMDSPLSLEKNFITLFPSFDLIDVDDYKDLRKIIEDEDGKVYFWLGGNSPSVACFEFVFGSKGRHKQSLYSLIFSLLKQDYEVCSSSIQYVIDKDEIMLNLVSKKPIKEEEGLDENTVVGVDIGTNTPAVCALNNDDTESKYIGSKDEFLRIRTQLRAQKDRLTNAKKILNNDEKAKIQKSLSRITKRRLHWCKNFNHLISKRVVEFALSNKAKYINLENMSKFSKIKKRNLLLEDWSYYELQTAIEYKAKEYGIVVRYVNPKNTSTTCSCCGEEDNTERIKTAKKSLFVCNNPNCNNKGKEINADYNAARNIAMANPNKKK